MIIEAVEDGISILTISTDKRNTLKGEDLDEFLTKLKVTGSSNTVKGIIVTGTGNVFSTGGNISTLLSLDSDSRIIEFFRKLDEILIFLFSFDKPFIAAVNGHSIGAGFLIQLCADVTIIPENKKIKFGLPELKIGLSIDAIMRDLITFNNIGMRKLGSLIYSGALFDATKAGELGIIDEEVDESELIGKSKSIINELVKDDLFPFMINKRVLRETTIRSMNGSFNEEKYRIFVELLNNEKTKQKLRAI